MEDSIILQVNSPPKFEEDIPYNVNEKILFGDLLNLTCITVQSPPTEKIQWFFKKNIFNETRELSASGTTLTIYETSDDHEGIYECVVWNKIGEAKRSFNVEILPRG